MFSKSCEYGLKAVIFLCMNSQENRRLNITEISEGIESPMHFTSKILQSLVRHGIVHSIKGPNGGFFIDVDDDPIPVISVIHAIEGNKVFSRCGLGLKNCSDSHPCPIHDEFKSYINKLKDIVSRTTIKDLAMKIKSGESYLNNN